MKWSHYQDRIFEEARSGTGHVIVQARAGCGKTSTIVEAMKYVPKGKRVLFCAFSKDVQTELASRIPRGVEAATLHALGRRAVVDAWGSVELDKERAEDFVREAFDEWELDRQSKHGFKSFRAACSLVSLAKNWLLDDYQSLLDLVDHVGHESSFYPEVIDLVPGVLARCREKSATIDFDDMIWLPIVHDMQPRQYDVVFVDEVQDLNPCQIHLAKKLCAPGGRIFAVGDDRQAIYGFRGASPGNVERLIEDLDAEVLPLPICYRCGREIVEFAQAGVPDLEAWDEAPQGRVSNDVMLDGVRKGDFVLARTNAAVISICLEILAAGGRAYMVGRDITSGLLTLIESTKATTVNELRAKLQRWYEDEKARTGKQYEEIGRDPKAALEALADRRECLTRLADASSTIAELKSLINRIATPSSADAIRCSTVHRAKGLEADQVWVLAESFTEDGDEEEQNLWYVASTRARKSLRIVGSRKTRQTSY